MPRKKTLSIVCKRIYDPYSPDDGYRILVDRLWPRGIKKEAARLDEWVKDIAPSDALRQWFHQQTEDSFALFTKRYKEELQEHIDELERLHKIVGTQKITLLYAAKNTAANNAIVLQQIIERLSIHKKIRK